MHHLFSCPRREISISRAFNQCQALVRFFALRRIKPHTPPLVRAPVNSFEFQPCGRTPPGGVLIALTPAQKGSIPLTPSTHRLRPGLPGYLIPFATLAFASQRQTQSERRLRHWCSSQYLRISPLHWEFPFPLLHSSLTVSSAIRG